MTLFIRSHIIGKSVYNLRMNRGIQQNHTQSIHVQISGITLFTSSIDPIFNFPLSYLWDYRLPPSKQNTTCILATSSYDNSSSSSSNIQPKSLLRYHLHKLFTPIKDWFQRLKQLAINVFFVSLRTSEIILRCTPFMILVPVSYLSPTVSISTFIHRTSWKYTLYTIQQLGPAFIKLFQWAATRRDLFPIYLCDELSQLQDTAYVHGWDHTHFILQQEFGQDYTNQLNIDPSNSIIGSGSAAQVYKGTLWNDKTGQEQVVAVKILHPGVRQSMERDLIFMKRIASLLGKSVVELFISLHVHSFMKKVILV